MKPDERKSTTFQLVKQRLKPLGMLVQYGNTHGLLLRTTYRFVLDRTAVTPSAGQPEPKIIGL